MAVLLLNASMQPLNVISHRRLIILLSKERVAFLDERSQREAAEALSGRRLPRASWSSAAPHHPCASPPSRPNRRNLLLRDDQTCQYCGFVGAAAELTVDHIVPMSRGGAGDRWENLVWPARGATGARPTTARGGRHAPPPVTPARSHRSTRTSSSCATRS